MELSDTKFGLKFNTFTENTINFGILVYFVQLLKYSYSLLIGFFLHMNTVFGSKLNLIGTLKSNFSIFLKKFSMNVLEKNNQKTVKTRYCLDVMWFFVVIS